ncbi:MAG: RecQ family zinc-binding domain-containing protein, partial [Cyanobacteria bacterium J06614_10]
VRRQSKEGDQALALLHRDGQLKWIDPFTYRVQVRANGRASGRASGKAVRKSSAVAVMQRYLFTRRCRWQVLLEEFGFAQEAETLRCGKCDRCLRA